MAEETKKASTKADDSVVLSKEEFASLISRIEAVEQKDDNKPISLLKDFIKEHTIRLRQIDGQIFLGIAKNEFGTYLRKEMRNELGSPDMMVTAQFLKAGKVPTDPDGIEEKKMFYLMDILNNSQELVVPILSTRKEVTIKNDGTVGQTIYRETANGGIKAEKTGRQVAAESKQEYNYHTIKTPDGREFEIGEEFINI